MLPTGYHVTSVDYGSIVSVPEFLTLMQSQRVFFVRKFCKE